MRKLKSTDKFFNIIYHENALTRQWSRPQEWIKLIHELIWLIIPWCFRCPRRSRKLSVVIIIIRWWLIIIRDWWIILLWLFMLINGANLPLTYAYAMIILLHYFKNKRINYFEYYLLLFLFLFICVF